MAVFKYDKLVNERDTQLKEKIINEELVYVMLRCIVQYRRATERFKGGDFWAKIAPASLSEVQSEVKEQTNHF
jgi:hypothetical protein